MSRLTLFLAGLVIVASSQQPGLGVAVPKPAMFLSKTYGFSLEVPVGWNVATGAAIDLPLFINFPWSRLQGQGILPMGVATIHIVAAAGLSRRHENYSLDEWAEFDELRAVPETVTSRVFVIPASTGVGRALMISFDEVFLARSGEQLQRAVIMYWEFRGKRFATYLSHVSGDPSSQQYEARLTNLMRSLRPLSASPARANRIKK